MRTLQAERRLLFQRSYCEMVLIRLIAQISDDEIGKYMFYLGIEPTKQVD